MAKKLKCPNLAIIHLFFEDVVSHSFFVSKINEGVKYVELHMVSVQQYRSYKYTYCIYMYIGTIVLPGVSNRALVTQGS